MAKWTLGILDGGGWGVGGVTTVCGRDYSYRMLHASMDYLNTMLRAELNYSRYPKSQMQFNSLNKQVLDVHAWL